MTDQSDHDQAARRETMLPGLIAAMKRHHRRRRIRRRIGAAGALVLVAAGGAWIVRGQAPAQPGRTVRPPAPLIPVVGQDYRTGLVRVIDDDELVRRLVEIDRPAGLIRTEGRVWLTSAVADVEIETDGEPEPRL
jgi:hypothetical protein